MKVAFSLILLLIALFPLACKREAKPLEPLSVEQMRSEFKKSFAGASREEKDLADAVLSTVEKKNYADAFVAVQELCRAAASDEKRNLLANRALLTINNLLQQAQAAGNAEAAAALRQYRNSR